MADLSQRKSIRLPEYDYSQFGYYFITICTEVGVGFPDPIKKMIDNQWQELKNKFDNIDLDEYVIMPNHLHGIVVIRRGGVTPPAAYGVTPPAINPTNGRGNPAPTFKQINVLFGRLPGTKLWQRNYYEHVIRNDESLNRIRCYIQTNPGNWDTDRNNPENF